MCKPNFFKITLFKFNKIKLGPFFPRVVLYELVLINEIEQRAKIIFLSVGVECYGGSNHTLTVQTGGSVTIPCYYDKKYTQQKKYWYSEIEKTYKNTSEENLSIIDHPDQSLFTVTMRNLQNKHNGNYYCVVETGEQPPIKTIYEPYLKIQSAPDVSVVSSSVSGHEGGDISVQCFYSSGYKNKLKQWCRYKDQSCYTVGRTDTSQNSSVQISDDGRRSFTVLMTGLRLTDSGWYWCSAGEAMNPVHLTVIEEESVSKEIGAEDKLVFTNSHYCDLFFSNI
uniref:Ig-like domain-containing protein n=1 Tax=Cyprinus carpio TaxID=7962 RepID=A0A8C1UCU3_CYPCA